MNVNKGIRLNCPGLNCVVLWPITWVTGRNQWGRRAGFKSNGVGKTTLVQKACDVIVSSGVSVEGFYTQEVREGRRRVGFDVVTVTGQRGNLSRVSLTLHAVAIIRCLSLMRLVKWSCSARRSSGQSDRPWTLQSSLSWGLYPSLQENHWVSWRRYGPGRTSLSSLSPRRTEMLYYQRLCQL
ncbi:cancer-related nucleoside-triphosphatase isoform X3 [Oncorhynchus mykiss]|uniref:cancer-related nucleoside-triphosphatase isoform X3 n=1 Tax=Oncorhynchus mykiss TaxID=8022 RepID=UPI0018784913|nr:cancer-related nucleoside-triphosphatase isoform X3 [Oncorhynchus mykiss]